MEVRYEWQAFADGFAAVMMYSTNWMQNKTFSIGRGRLIENHSQPAPKNPAAQ